VRRIPFPYSLHAHLTSNIINKLGNILSAVPPTGFFIGFNKNCRFYTRLKGNKRKNSVVAERASPDIIALRKYLIFKAAI